MRKNITYTTFSLSTLVVIFIFVTSKTYVQLAIAIMMYIILSFLFLKIFPRKNVTKIDFPPLPAKKILEKANDIKSKEQIEISDIDKRAFLKLIGAAGLSFFISSFLGRRVDDLFTKTTLTSPEPASSDPDRPTTEYKISEIDNSNGTSSFYGFTKQGGSWFIMKEELSTGSFRYTKGDTKFPTNWKYRENLKYDYYSNIF